MGLLVTHTKFQAHSIVLGGDSATVVNWLNSHGNHHSSEYPILLKIKWWLSNTPDCKVYHIHREGNRVADYVAEMAMAGNYNLSLYDPLPPQLNDILQADCWEVVFC